MNGLPPVNATGPGLPDRPRSGPVDLAILAAATILCFTASILIVASIFMLLQIGLSGAVFVLSALLASAFFFLCALGKPGRIEPFRAVVLYGGLLLFFVLSGVLSHNVLDASWDGQEYHQPAVLYLLEGWNPFFEQVPDRREGSLRINHYPKAFWIYGASLARLTGSVEAGKSFNALLLVVALLLLAAAVATRNPPLDRRKLVLAVLIVLNPVVVKSLFTYYVDGQVGSLLVALGACLVILRVRQDLPVLASLLFGILCIVNTKFNGLIFAGILCVGYLSWLGMRGARWKRPVGIAAAGFIVGTAFVGYNPYVTNVLRHGNVFYPASVVPATGAFAEYGPPNLRGRTRVEKLLYSAFSETHSGGPDAPARLKLPLSLARREILSAGGYDTRIGGFGPFFGLELIVFATFVAVALVKGLRLEPDIAVVALLFLVSAVLFPEPWWARFVPQLWAAPLLFALAGREGRQGRALAWLEGTLALTAALNVALSWGVNAARVAVWNQELRSGYGRVLEMGRSGPVEVKTDFVEVTRARLGRLGVQALVRDTLSCPNPLEIPAAKSAFCPRPGSGGP